MDAQAYFWFFSTSAQVFGGLVALLGVFIVYANDSIDRAIEASRKDIEEYSRKAGLNLGGQTLSFQITTVGQWGAGDEVARKSKEPYLTNMEKEVALILALQVKRGEVTKEFVRLAIFLLAIVCVSLVLLPFSGLLLDCPKVKILILILVIVGEIVGLIEIGKFLIKSIKK